MVGILGMLGQGIANAGANVATFAHDAGVIQMKADLERQSQVLANQLATEREHNAPGVAEDVATKKLNLKIAQAQARDRGIDIDDTPSADAGTPSQSATASAPTTSQPVSPAGGTASDPVLSGGGKIPAITASQLPPGMSIDTFKRGMLYAPQDTIKTILDWHKAHDVRKGSDETTLSDATGTIEPVYKNTGVVTPFTDADRQKFGLIAGDKGYLDESGKPVILQHADNPNAAFNPDGTPNLKFQEWELKKTAAGRGASADRDILTPILSQILKGGEDSLDANQKAVLSIVKPQASSGDEADPTVQSWVKNVTNGSATMQQVPQRYRNATSRALANLPTDAYTPVAVSRLSAAAQRIREPFLKNPGYELVQNGQTYLSRIDAAMKYPGSVSDQDLLDSLTKLNTSGNAVTDAQVRIITDGKSFSDWASTVYNKLNTGGVLSNAQRQEVDRISHSIFDNYRKQYAPVYEQLTGNLRAAGIPEAFWGVPDLEKISEQTKAAIDQGSNRSSAPPSIPDQAKAQLRPGTVTTFANGQRWTLDPGGKPVQVQ